MGNEEQRVTVQSAAEQPPAATATSWTPRPPLNEARGGLISATLDSRIYAIGGGRIFVLGGGSSDGPQRALRTSEVYDPDADRWERLDALFPVMRSSLSAARDVPAREPEVIISFGGFEGTTGNLVPSTRVEALVV
jgi:Kelch motif